MSIMKSDLKNTRVWLTALLCALMWLSPPFALTASAQEESDTIDIPEAPPGLDEQIICRLGYVVSYNKTTLNPNWVAWHLIGERIDGIIERHGRPFHEDEEVPEPRATLADYKGSGWTRGHICPAADNKWDEQAMYDSFAMTNICPQTANLNTGVWNQIEISCRRWAKKYGDLYIVSGPIYLNQVHETIGENHVVVPEAFFKVIIHLGENPKGIGFICRNNDTHGKKDMYVNSIKQVERITKYKFFPSLDEETAEIVKNQADIKDW